MKRGTLEIQINNRIILHIYFYENFVFRLEHTGANIQIHYKFRMSKRITITARNRCTFSLSNIFYNEENTCILAKKQFLQ